MEITPIVKAKVTMTLDDLRILAWVLMREVTSPDQKIATIKKMREFTRDAIPVTTYGEPLTYVIAPCSKCGDDWCKGSTREIVVRFGLKECKDALDSWFVNRQFIG